MPGFKWRSPHEIAFRLKQEVANRRLLRTAPKPAAPVAPRPLPLPAPQAILPRIENSAYAASVIAIAENCLQRKLPMLGYTLEPGREIRWRKDYVHGPETDLSYFRRIPYLDAAVAGDHKIIWELNRHQHLLVMAQATLLTGRADFLDDLCFQLETWLEQNPFCRGINWTSALEVAFRALSWIWIEHLVGPRLPEPLRTNWLTAMFQHGCYLENNLSVYFSPNTHLQGEALALHALGMVFADQPAAAKWRATGSGILARIIESHVRPDGGHFEQSSYYQIYAMDMFLLHAVLETVSVAYLDRLRSMARYLWALGSSGEIPLLGDDDGGRLFHPYGNRRAFVRATLASCAALLGDASWLGDPRDLDEQAAWWLGAKAYSTPVRSAAVSSRRFPDSGIVVLAENDVQAIVDTRAFGFGSAGHSHAHALHFTLRRGHQDVLLDPGTYTYVSDPLWRDRFRGTAAHNTVRVDAADQATSAGPFRWENLPDTEVVRWSEQPWMLHARCRYRGICHHRQMMWVDGVLFVLDHFEGSGSHRLEQFWHPAKVIARVANSVFHLAGDAFLAFPEASSIRVEEDGEFGWYSPLPGVKQSRTLLCVEAEFPQALGAAFVFQQAANPPGPLQMRMQRGEVGMECGGRQALFHTRAR